MIGQTKILDWVDKNINSFPHFIVLVGSSGCGKKTLAREIAHKLSLVYAECEIKVDTVREVIDTAYQSNTDVMYCFADADNMRPQAKNAMLKITEEPPQRAYFCMTVSDDSSLLDTIKSRAYVFYMDSYDKEDLLWYYKEDKTHYDNYLEESDVLDICDTPHEIDMICNYDKEFIDFVTLVIDNIAEVEPANAFKSSNKLALKNEDGYDLALFWKCFIQICLKRLKESENNKIGYYCNGMLVTSKYLNKVNKLGVNKTQLYDSWVFEIRNVWLESN